MSHCKRFIFCALLLNLVAMARLQAQGQCAQKLAEAEEKYQSGRLEQAIALANQCLEKSGFALAERERAYKLLGMAYYAKGLHDAAKENLRKLLELIPNWRPDPENDSPSFQKLAEEVIKEVEAERQAQRQQAQKAQPPDTSQSQLVIEPPPTKKGGGRKWLWIGGSAFAAGTVAFLISQGEEKPARLPDPPAVPRK